MRVYAEVGGRRPPPLGGHNPPREILADDLAAAVWRTAGDPRITVAVLDGPCDTTHPCFRGAAITQLDLLGVGAARGPAAEHGTHTASIIFGQPGGPVAGIAPRCRGLSIPIFRDSPSGGISPCSQPDLARAVRAAVERGAHVVNVSGGQFSPLGVAHPALAAAVQECRAAGRLIVAAAGNDGCPCLHVPGALPSVLVVGAMDERGEPLEFSNWGARYLRAGVLAPGVNILGALPGGGVERRVGTSYATPIVSGLAALLFSAQVRRGRPPDAEAVRAAILDTALGCEHRRVGDCRRLLAGRLNVGAAMARILEGGRKMSDPIVSEAPVAQPDAPVDPSCDGGGSAEIVSRTVREREVKPADSGGEPPGEARGRPAAEGAVLASECSCRENGQFVYVVGDLGIDFGTQARLDSIQQGADTFNSGAKLDVRIVGYLLRHLLGWREIDADGGASYHRPHLYDADAVIWVLRMDESPVYAVRPGGPYAEDAYLELIRFLMEQEGYDERTEAVRENDRVERIIYPSLDTQNGSEPNRSRDKLGRPTRIIERVAIPGRLKGSVELYDGSVVPVISPDMRGTRSWSMPALVEMHAAVDPMLAEHQDQAKVMRNLDRITERFFEDVRNRGLAPEERAVNFVATQVFRFVPFLRDQFGEGFEPELDSISVSRSLICRQDSDCYDVEVAFFDPENVLRSKMVKARTVDVSDVVPVLLGDEREYRRR